MRSESDGNGPVDASLKAIEAKVGSGAEMLLYSVNAITSGSTESQGEVTVRLQLGGRIVNGVGSDPDIVVASAKAYLAALNKLHSNDDRVAAQGFALGRQALQVGQVGLRTGQLTGFELALHVGLQRGGSGLSALGTVQRVAGQGQCPPSLAHLGSQLQPQGGTACGYFRLVALGFLALRCLLAR